MGSELFLWWVRIPPKSRAVARWLLGDDRRPAMVFSRRQYFVCVAFVITNKPVAKSVIFSSRGQLLRTCVQSWTTKNVAASRCSSRGQTRNHCALDFEAYSRLLLVYSYLHRRPMSNPAAYQVLFGCPSSKPSLLMDDTPFGNFPLGLTGPR